MFKKAKRASRKLRMAIAGIAGSGKTYTALTLASRLGKKVALLDTERSSAEIYSTLFEFDVAQLSSHHPQKYVDAINEAAKAKYDVMIIDSLSHAWIGREGALDLVSKQGKTFNAWGKVTPLQDKLIDTIMSFPGHVIATLRMKQAYEQAKDDKGKITVAKIGLATQQRDGIDYEFDLFGVMDALNNLTIEKSRCPALAGQLFAQPGEELAGIILHWLKSGEEEEVVFAPAVNGTLDGELREKVSAIVKGNEELVHKFLQMKGQINGEQTWQNMTMDYALRITDQPKEFLSCVAAVSKK